MDCVPLKSADVGGQLAYDRTLRTQRRKESTLLFVAWRGELVFDAANPSVFARYAGAAPAAAPRSAAARVDGSAMDGLGLLPSPRACSPASSPEPARHCRSGRGGWRSTSVEGAAWHVHQPATPQLQHQSRPSPATVSLGRRNMDELIGRARSPAAAAMLRAASTPLRRALSPHPARPPSEVVAAAMGQVSMPSLCYRGISFSSIEELRAHFKQEHG
jgi:hypothetical protein